MNKVPETFVKPVKYIIDNKPLFSSFRFSPAFFYISTFIQQVNILVKDMKISEHPDLTPQLAQLLEILNKVHMLIKDTPPVERQQRYGNPSFKTFIEKLEKVSLEYHKEILASHEDAFIEINAYFMDMFGSYGRLDYGTGHELNFVCWMICFLRLQIFGTKEDLINCAFVLLPKYIQISQDIQNVYTLEPAGSHGAWSVDDYNLLPFVWGSAQFIGQEGQSAFTSKTSEQVEKQLLGLKDIFKQQLVRENSAEYLYFTMLENIYNTKTYELYTNSPFISELHMKPDMNWEKLNKGMYSHYEKEVLGIWPVIQHFWFGNILNLK